VRRLVFAACFGVLLAAGGCSERRIEVAVQQPMAFPHQAHLTYFASGQHRAEKIRMHLKIFDLAEPPQELAEGRCVECHDDLAERKACAGCHVPFQNAALRHQTELRRCVGCHRGAWTTPAATIPSAAVCVSCHEIGARAARSGDNTGARVVLVRAGEPASTPVEDIPWMRINTLPPNVYFSHTAHVRFAAMSCTTCHQDVRPLRSPPTMVRVFAMSECLACHAQKGASTDCLTCHK
jgi:menaquinone reductase, multiheme cytochrome c subunit